MVTLRFAGPALPGPCTSTPPKTRATANSQVPDTRAANLRPSTIRADWVAILKESERMTKGTVEDVDESHTLARHCRGKPSFRSRLAGSGR